MQLSYDKYLEKKDNKGTIIPPDEKMKILIKYFETNTKPPSRSKTAEYNIQSGFSLGQFWNHLLQGSNKDLFEKARKNSTNMQLAYEKYLEKKKTMLFQLMKK